MKHDTEQVQHILSVTSSNFLIGYNSVMFRYSEPHTSQANDEIVDTFDWDSIA